MKVLTNRNKNNKFHDNINYQPIELQVSELLKEHYKDVKFEASSGELKYTINNNKDFVIKIYLKDNCFVVYFDGHKLRVDRINRVSTGDITYNTDCSKEIKKLVKDIEELRNKDSKIIKMLEKIIDDKDRKKYFDNINKYLGEYFKSDFFYVDAYDSIGNFLHTEPLFNYFCISIVPYKELFGNNKGAVQVPIGFDGKIMDTHPYNGKNIFQDCIETLHVEKYKCKEGFLNLDTLKRIVKELEKLEVKLKTFNAMDCSEFKEILEINENCYKFLTVKK